MRKKLLAIAAAAALGTVAMTGNALAFGHGGGGGFGGGGHAGGGAAAGGHAGGGFGGGGFAGARVGGFAGANIGAARGQNFASRSVAGRNNFSGRNFATNGAVARGNWGRDGWRHGFRRRGFFGPGVALGLGGLYAYAGPYCDPYDPNAYAYGYCGYDYSYAW